MGRAAQPLQFVVNPGRRSEPSLGSAIKARRWAGRQTVPAVVQKIVKSVYQDRVEKLEISIPEADDLFREIRIENTLTDADGQPVALKTGAQLDVTFEAEAKDTVKKSDRYPA